MSQRSESPARRPKGRREQRSWRGELRRQQAASKGGYANGGLPRKQTPHGRPLPGMPVFNLPPIEDEGDGR